MHESGNLRGALSLEQERSGMLSILLQSTEAYLTSLGGTRESYPQISCLYDRIQDDSIASSIYIDELLSAIASEHRDSPESDIPSGKGSGPVLKEDAGVSKRSKAITRTT